MKKEVIIKNFSKCARHYDRHSIVQNLCASKLVARIDGFYRSILDIGCGTGNFTRLLRERFPSAAIKAIDISNGMVKVARGKLEDEGIEFILADGETVEFDREFDLISSNSSFQWFEDLEGGLVRCGNFLKDGGLLAFSTFGPLTFYELNSSLRALFGDGVSISSCNFVKRSDLAEILKRNFREVIVEEELFVEEHRSLLELLNKVKYTGTRGNGVNGNGLWTTRTMAGLERIYREKFPSLTSTYQVFFCRAAR